MSGYRTLSVFQSVEISKLRFMILSQPHFDEENGYVIIMV